MVSARGVARTAFLSMVVLGFTIAWTYLSLYLVLTVDFALSAGGDLAARVAVAVFASFANIISLSSPMTPLQWNLPSIASFIVMIAIGSIALYAILSPNGYFPQVKGRFWIAFVWLPSAAILIIAHYALAAASQNEYAACQKAYKEAVLSNAHMSAFHCTTPLTDLAGLAAFIAVLGPHNPITMFLASKLFALTKSKNNR